MPSLVLSDFKGGLNTKSDAWKIATNQLRLAENVVLRDGNLTPLKGLGAAVTTGLGAGTWAWIYLLGANWLASTSQRYAVLWQSTYLAYVTVGAAPPQWTNGTSTSPLGLSLPVAAITAATGAAGVIISTSARYVATFVDALGQESGPSPLSPVLAVNLQQVNLTTIPLGGAGTTARKVYRLVVSSYRLVTTINDNTTTTYTDNTADSQLGQPLLTADAGPAPNLQGLAINTYDAALWGWINNVLYHSNVGAPHAWSTASNNLSDNIVAAGSVGSMLIVLTASGPWRVTGQGPNYTYKEAPNTYGCPVGAGFSLVKSDHGLIYWSTQGLVLTDGVTFTLLSGDALSTADVAAYTAVASSMIGAYADGYYHLFTSIGTLTCDLRGGSPVFTTNTQTIGAAYTTLGGALYVSSGNAVYPWATGANRTMRVETMAFVFGPDLDTKTENMRRVGVSTAGTVTPQFYQNGVSWGTYSAVAAVNGVGYCWSTLGNWDRPSLRLTSSNVITQLEVNT